MVRCNTLASAAVISCFSVSTDTVARSRLRPVESSQTMQNRQLKQGVSHPSIESSRLALHKYTHGTILHRPLPCSTPESPDDKQTNRSSRERVDLLLQLPVHGRDGGASDSRAVQVLERREQGGNTRLLGGFGVSAREGGTDGGVVNHVTRFHICVQSLVGPS